MTGVLDAPAGAAVQVVGGWTHLGRVDDQTHEGGHELVSGQRRTLALVLRESVRQRQRVRVSQGGHAGGAGLGAVPGPRRHPRGSGGVTGKALRCDRLSGERTVSSSARKGACVGAFTAHPERPLP